MANNNIISDKQKIFLEYLIQFPQRKQENIPSIQSMSEDLGLSTACLREQMELAKNLGIISARPRKGIEILPYKFSPAASKSLYYAVNLDYSYFVQYSEVRNHLEKAYFLESVQLLDSEEISRIQLLVDAAFKKLDGFPVQIPHDEHRKYHMSFYIHLENIFLTGLLEAYWDVYELVGLSIYSDLEYLKKVWDYHAQIIENISKGNLETSFELLCTHMEFISQRE